MGWRSKAAYRDEQGRSNEFNWGVVNPTRWPVSRTIRHLVGRFRQDPGVWPKHDIPLLHVVGTEDWVLRTL